MQKSPWQLQTLDLSENKFTKEMLTTLASSFRQFPIGLTNLHLARCGIPSNLFTLLFSTFKEPSWISTLRVLDISFNTLDNEGTVSLVDWISSVSALQRLAIAGTNLDTTKFFRALRNNSALYASSLTELDISYSTLKEDACMNFSEILVDSKTLCTLVLRGITVPKQGFQTILSPWFTNARLHDMTLSADLSENDFSGLKGKALAELFKLAPALNALRLNRCGLRDDTLAVLVTALGCCKSIQALHIENNGGKTSTINSIFSAAPSLEDKPGDAFLKLLTTNKNLKEMYLSSHNGGHRYSMNILRPILHSIGISFLEVLDISGNRGGDDVAKSLALALPKTTQLRALFWDENHTSLAGFELFQEGLRQNTSVVVMPVPIQDTRRLLDGRDPPREELFALLGAYYAFIQRNQTMMSVSVMESVIIREYDESDTWRNSMLRSTTKDLRQSWSAAVQTLVNKTE
ncbi:hypothetical protein THRCLA_03608 [Thraustotheca clavata]|uniref:Uncharacterized protein n=1 Tax=Thraustotheca clavata TaxID=74557 RepID=A0A1W0A1I2_9STRA|nr:hypothetical protein THRCLA_03608 [Thraustotheca clavata]